MFYENTSYYARTTCGVSLKKAASIVRGGYNAPRKYPTKYRKDVQMGELFCMDNDTSRVYLHTGKRTVPPSDSRAYARTHGTVNGKPVIGFQALLIKGQAQDDGAFYTKDGNKRVQVVGTATISPTYH